MSEGRWWYGRRCGAGVKRQAVNEGEQNKKMGQVVGSDKNQTGKIQYRGTGNTQNTVGKGLQCGMFGSSCWW